MRWVVGALAAGLLQSGLGAADGTAPSAPPDAAVPQAQDFLSLGAEARSVKVVLITAFNGANYGMNFNGFAKGGAKYVIPKGWNVEVAFTNRSPVPHSAVVVERAMVKRLQMGDPACTGGSTTNPVRGTTGTKGETFRFKPEEAGEFAFACGFPAHAANGHWIGLEISETATAPSLQFGTNAPYVPAAR
jgi:hypothetical protein